MNERGVGHRIAERHAQLDYRRALARKLNDQLAGCFQIRISRDDERDEAFPAFSFERSEFFGDSTQKEFTTEDTEGSQRSLWSSVSSVVNFDRTVSTSLSPRPDRLMIRI